MSWRDDPVVEDPRAVPVPPSGIPQSGPSRVGEEFGAMAKATGRYAKTSALPTIGSMVLPAAATALFPPAAPFAPVLRGVGSGLGEVANQALGITEPSLSQIGLATALPMGLEVGANVLRTGKALPGRLNTAAPAMAMQQMAGYRSAVPAKQLFQEAADEGMIIPLKRTKDMLSEIRLSMKDATPAAKRAFEGVTRDIGLDDVLKETKSMRVSGIGDVTTAEGVNPMKMQNLLADVGKLQVKAAREGGLRANYLGKLFSSLSDDLESSGSRLDIARQAFKRETVLDEINDAIKNAFFIKKGVGQQGEFSANKILNTLNKTDEGLGKFFHQSFSGQEQREIKDLFGFLNTLPSLKPGAGVQYGSGRAYEMMLKSGAGGGVGFGLGYLSGGPGGAAIGAGVGALAPEVANFGSMVLQAWRLPGGRQMVKSLLTNSEGAITPQVMGTLGAFVAGKLSTEMKPSVPMQAVPPTMVQPMGLMR